MLQPILLLLWDFLHGLNSISRLLIVKLRLNFSNIKTHIKLGFIWVLKIVHFYSINVNYKRPWFFGGYGSFFSKLNSLLVCPASEVFSSALYIK